MSSYEERVRGCLDGNCIWRRPKGMHTNGGCKCTRGLEWRSRHYEALTPDERRQWRRDWVDLRTRISLMRDEIERLQSDD